MISPSSPTQVFEEKYPSWESSSEEFSLSASRPLSTVSWNCSFRSWLSGSTAAHFSRIASISLSDFAVSRTAVRVLTAASESRVPSYTVQSWLTSPAVRVSEVPSVLFTLSIRMVPYLLSKDSTTEASGMASVILLRSFTESLRPSVDASRVSSSSVSLRFTFIYLSESSGTFMYISSVSGSK